LASSEAEEGVVFSIERNTIMKFSSCFLELLEYHLGQECDTLEKIVRIRTEIEFEFFLWATGLRSRLDRWEGEKADD
jgi:hypothetical protein